MRTWDQDIVEVRQQIKSDDRMSDEQKADVLRTVDNIQFKMVTEYEDCLAALKGVAGEHGIEFDKNARRAIRLVHRSAMSIVDNLVTDLVGLVAAVAAGVPEDKLMPLEQRAQQSMDDLFLFDRVLNEQIIQDIE